MTPAGPSRGVLRIAQTGVFAAIRVKVVRIRRPAPPDIVRDNHERIQNPYGGCCWRVFLDGNRASHATQATADT
jgi:hypothetical protein